MGSEVDNNIKEFENRIYLLFKNNDKDWGKYKELYDEIKAFEKNKLSDEQIKKYCILNRKF